MPAFDADRDEVVARARAAGVERMLIVGGVDEEEGHLRALRVAEGLGFPVSAGVHPHEARLADEAIFDALRGLGRRAPGRAAVLLASFALAVGAPGSSLFLWRPAAASAAPNPGLWGLLLVLAASLQWAAVVRLARVVVLDEPGEPASDSPPRTRATYLWWAIALFLIYEMALSLSHRTLGPPSGSTQASPRSSITCCGTG